MTLRALICTCGKPTRAESYICDDCKDGLWRAIGDAAALSDELDVTLTRQQRMTEGSRRGTEKPLPYDAAASDVLRELGAVLRQLVRLCVMHRVDSRGGIESAPAEQIGPQARWLLWRIDAIAAQPWAADAARDVVRIARRAEYVIDRPPERSFAGPCDECGRDLYAQHEAVTATCSACGLVYDLAERRAWLLDALQDRLATAVEIARALTSLEQPVTSERIRQWAHRERIVSSGHDRLGRPLYRVGDVVTLLIESADKRHARQTGQRA